MGTKGVAVHFTPSADFAGATAEELRQRVLRAYRLSDWNTTHAAKMMGVTRRTLLRWVRLLKIKAEITKQRRAA